MNTLTEQLAQNRYHGYAYSYPHKMAYRVLDTPTTWEQAWANEKRDALFLYLHLPYCEMRCGFCNLFTLANPKGNQETSYLAALERQTEAVANALPAAKFSRFALGGGTPTYLSAEELSLLFALIENRFGVSPAHVPTTIETSPGTATPEKIALLKQLGIHRVSIGVQSFVQDELKSLGRPVKVTEQEHTLQLLADADFPVHNIDLIYGAAGQTPKSWRYSLDKTMAYDPEEVFLYPLYVRPLTGLSKTQKEWDDQRFQLYQLGRDYLLENGYEQVSMRLFRRKKNYPENTVAYSCQEDGMVGLGVGARSYTSHLHYSSDYAVGKNNIKDIIRSFHDSSYQEMQQIRYGKVLTEQEKMTRFVIKSLLHEEGLNLNRFRALYRVDATEAFPVLHQLRAEGLCVNQAETLRLTPAGLGLSDAIGPHLYDERTVALMNDFELK